MRSSVRRLATLFFTVVSVLLGSCEETQPRGDTGPAPVDLAALAEEAPEAWAYDARTGLWSPSVFTVVVAGTELYRDGRLYRVTSAGLVDRGAVAPEALDAAEETYVAEALHWTPGPDDWVLVLGAHDEAGHVPLRDVRPGDRFAYQGRIFETRPSSSGSLDVRHTGEVLSSVEQTIARRVHDVIDASIQYADGTTETIRATPDHPFYLPSHRGYVDLRDVEIGSTLHVSGGGEALLVSKTWRQGDFEVFNFEVAEQHNYFVRSAGSEQSGLLVHNTKCKGKDFRGGKKKKRDRDFGIKDREFWRWWHREKRHYGGDDIEPEDIWEIFEDWLKDR